jgi:3-hydroxyacyl-[acyl-carrier-protein] dehydratase
MLLNEDEVLKYLPHRKPFLFIDTVKDVIVPDSIKGKDDVEAKDLVGTKVIANFKISKDLEILKGHFPGNPILPGVVQIEMMAQASAFVSLALNGLSIDGVNVETLLLAVESAKYRKPLLPGEELEIHATMDKSRGTVAHYFCEIFSEGKRVSEAKILAKLDIITKDS